MNSLHGHQRTRLALRLAAAVAITLFFLFPIYWLFMISFKTPDEIFSFPPKWYPGQIQFRNYSVLFKDGDAIAVWHSLVLAGGSTLIAMFLGTICAYSLARRASSSAGSRSCSRRAHRSSCSTARNAVSSSSTAPAGNSTNSSEAARVSSIQEKSLVGGAPRSSSRSPS